jgi:hypothetical protein
VHCGQYRVLRVIFAANKLSNEAAIETTLCHGDFTLRFTNEKTRNEIGVTAQYGMVFDCAKMLQSTVMDRF